MTRYVELSGIEQGDFLTPSIPSFDETYTSTVRHSTLAASGSSAIASCLTGIPAYLTSILNSYKTIRVSISTISPFEHK